MENEDKIRINKLMGSLMALSKDDDNYYECVIKVLENYLNKNGK